MSPRRGELARTGGRWLAWTVGCLTLWVFLTVSTQLDQVVAGTVISASVATVAEAARAQTGLRVELAALPWAAVPRQALRVVLDCGLLAGVLWRAVIRGERVAGRLRVATLPGVDEGPRGTAIGAGAVYLGSLAPNAYVIGVAPEEGLVLFHELVRTGGLPPGAVARETR